MRFKLLRAFCDAVLNELHEIYPLPSQFNVGVVDPSCSKQSRGQVVETICLLINQDDESLFRAGQCIHFDQTGARASYGRQRCLKSVGEAIQDGRTKLFTLTGRFSTAL